MRNLYRETDFAGVGEKVGIGFDGGWETRRHCERTILGGSREAVGVTCT